MSASRKPRLPYEAPVPKRGVTCSMAVLSPNWRWQAGVWLGIRGGSLPLSLGWSLFPPQGSCTDQAAVQPPLSHHHLPLSRSPPLSPAHFPAGSRSGQRSPAQQPGLWVCSGGSRSLLSPATTSAALSPPSRLQEQALWTWYLLASSPCPGFDSCLGEKRG